MQSNKKLVMTDMVIIKKELIDDKLKVFYRPRRNIQCKTKNKEDV